MMPNAELCLLMAAERVVLGEAAAVSFHTGGVWESLSLFARQYI